MTYAHDFFRIWAVVDRYHRGRGRRPGEVSRLGRLMSSVRIYRESKERAAA